MKKVLITIIQIYRQTLSRFLFFYLGPGCKFKPTCSEYMINSIRKYGSRKGIILGAKRLSTCHSF